MLTYNVSLPFLMIVFQYIVTLAKGAEIFTLEEYRLIKGKDFCTPAKEGFFLDNVCVQIADENGFKNYKLDAMYASCYKEVTIFIFNHRKYKVVSIKEDLLVCQYNRNDGLIDGRESVTQFASKAVGKGKEANDVMEYDYDRVATPYANREGLLNKIHVMTLEQFNRQVEGEDFCKTKKNSDYFKLICVNIAEKNDITEYTIIEVKNTCDGTNISLFSREKKQEVIIQGELLYCNYIRDGVQFASRALGRGKGESDVMEHTLNADVAKPRIDRPNLLNEIHILTLEEYQLLTGEEFCTTQKNDDNSLENLCVKAAVANDFEKYMKNMLDASCSKSTITLFSAKENKLVQTEENLLHCKYVRVHRSKTQSEPSLRRFASRALGRGKKQNDVMEYNYSYHKAIATPFANRVDLLEVIVA